MKIGIIIKREYLTRVKKRSFLILTLLAPLFFAAIMFLPAILMENSEKFDQKKVIAVRDESELFLGKFENTDFNTFIYIDRIDDQDEYYVKIESILTDEDSVEQTKNFLVRTLRQLGETDIAESAYFEL